MRRAGVPIKTPQADAKGRRKERRENPFDRFIFDSAAADRNRNNKTRK